MDDSGVTITIDFLADQYKTNLEYFVPAVRIEKKVDISRSKKKSYKNYEWFSIDVFEKNSSS